MSQRHVEQREERHPIDAAMNHIPITNAASSSGAVSLTKERPTGAR